MTMQDALSCGSGAIPCRSRTGQWLTLKQIVSVCMLLAGVTACSGQESKKPDMRPIEVTVVTVIPRNLPVSFEYVAQTQSSHQVNIQARVSGFLDKRVYTEGSMVKAGQILFLMDKKPFQAQVNGAAAALARQKAAMETARLNLERTKPLTAQNALVPEGPGRCHRRIRVSRGCGRAGQGPA